MADPSPTSLDAAAQRELVEMLHAWLPTRRWFAGKGHELTAVNLTAVTLTASAPADPAAPPDPAAPDAAPEADGPSAVAHAIVGVQLDGDHWQTYQVPVSLYEKPRDDLDPVGRLSSGTWVYDAVSDADAVGAVLGTAHRPPVVDPEQTHGAATGEGPRRPTLEAATDPSGYRGLRARPLSVEQSNTSVVFGDVALLKLFRQLVPGTNPDVEVHAALGVARCPHVGRCLGWINGSWRDPADGRWVSGHLGMVAELLSPAVDGWELALARVGAGEPMAELCHELGRATGAVHLALRTVMPSHVLDPAEVAGLADRLHWRLDNAVARVGELAPLASQLHARLDALRAHPRPIAVQRVHGDYHLGQVLHTTSGWKLLDFEGEPGAAISARVVADHPLRDVAGMLRSFAYAAAQGGGARPHDEVARWQAQCEAAFLAGYADSGAADPGADADAAILTAYLVDKAAYEAAYESRNRPDWLPIPLAALTELAATQAP